MKKVSAKKYYEYFEDNDRVIVFVTENLSNVLTESEIFKSLINLF